MENKASITRMALAVFAALKLILEPFGVEIPQDLIDAIANAVGALVIVYTAWRNNYVSQKGQQQRNVLEKNGLL